MGILFFDLPAELKTEIISMLDFQDILALRRCTAAFKLLIDVSELEITRYHIKHILDSHTLELFPPPEPPLLNLGISFSRQPSFDL